MITIRDLSINFGGEPLFENANLKIEKDDKFALVGPNGAGKTTLLKIIAGTEESDTGSVYKQNGISIGYLPQEFMELKGSTLFEEVKSSLKEIVEIEAAENEIQKKLADESVAEEEKRALLNEFGELQHKKEHIDFYAAESKIEKVLIGLGFSEADFTKNVSEFSGGWKMRAHLAKILIAEHDLIMLDEPTNHLDLYSLRWLVNFLENYKGALLIVSHDLYFVESVTKKTVEISNRKFSVFNGKFSHYLKYKEERERELLELKKSQEKRIKEIERFIERFRYKATKAKQVQSRIKYLEKLDKIEIEEQSKSIKIEFNKPPRVPSVLLKVKNLFKSYGNHSVLENVSFEVERGDKIAFVGLNGAGKSTLAKILAKKIGFDKGELTINEMTKAAYFSQEATDNLDLTKDALDTLWAENGDYTLSQIRNILGAFLFSDDDVFKKVSVLSGGEKARLALARLLLKKANLLILDEPTNHLDFSSKKVLQSALKDFEGSIILISHDIEFMKPFINKVLEFENKRVKLYYGGIENYIEKYEARLKDGSVKNENAALREKNNSRKEQKRLEAELRQKRYKATKDLKLQIEEFEKRISELENEKAFLQNEMTKEEIYSNPAKMKEIQTRFKDASRGLDEAIDKWTELSEQLEEIESSFSLSD